MDNWFTSAAPRVLTRATKQQNDSRDGPFKLAQITDCHLFADERLFDGIDSSEYLCRTLIFLATQNLDGVMLTGDVTQDHSDASFAKFATIYRQYLPDTPLYWVAGNHDEYEQIARALDGWPFFADKHLSVGQWQILLIDSKGPTPSGYVSEQHFTDLQKRLDDLSDNQQVLCFCHHHPLPVYSYIDKHGLDNGQQLVDVLLQYPQVKALAYGHVHQFRYQSVYCGYGHKNKADSRKGQLNSLALYATGATSIQFTVNSKVKASEDLGPACRLFCLPQQGPLSTEEIYIDRLG